MVAVWQAALVSNERALEACLQRCTIQIDDLYLFTFNGAKVLLCLSALHLCVV